MEPDASALDQAPPSNAGVALPAEMTSLATPIPGTTPRPPSPAPLPPSDEPFNPLEDPWVYSANELYYASPSVLAGMDVKDQERMRKAAMKFIINSVTRTFNAQHKIIISTATQLYHRFFARQSMLTFESLAIASMSIHLAAKILDMWHDFQDSVRQYLSHKGLKYSVGPPVERVRSCGRFR
jgi:hypothetical protein